MAKRRCSMHSPVRVTPSAWVGCTKCWVLSIASLAVNLSTKFH
ncbi:hypothetical protein E2C01_036094 [Portunus trituberculatus]|uniref:Uncharacterized protein n=1 Tax=Portunus trituberculatus TaxID=210409 RepID=A0A5B7FBI8_PORTR|nr:hypothetical protein [Portunus trituberculatus]